MVYELGTVGMVNHTPRIIEPRPIQPCQLIVAVSTKPLPIEQPPASYRYIPRFLHCC
jgi:hypothetical protein